MCKSNQQKRTKRDAAAVAVAIAAAAAAVAVAVAVTTDAPQSVVMCARQKAKRMCAQSTLSASLVPPPFSLHMPHRTHMYCMWCTVHSNGERTKWG